MTDTRVLVTGAGGSLGAAVADELVKRRVPTRGLGRRLRPERFLGDWIQSDLLSGKGLGEAFEDVSAVVHCASNPRQPKDDLKALDHLIDACRSRNAHLIYISIAGTEDAMSASPYFRVKRDCEKKIAASGCQYTIVRSTQFHPFVESLINRLTVGPILLEPDLTFQPVDPRFAAEILVAHSLGRAEGIAPDLNGPERLRFGELLMRRLQAGARKKVRLRIPAIGPLAAFHKLQMVEGRSGGRTWLEWLDARRVSQLIASQVDKSKISGSGSGNSE